MNSPSTVIGISASAVKVMKFFKLLKLGKIVSNQASKKLKCILISIVKTASGVMSPTTGNFNIPLKFVITFIFGMISFTVNLVAPFSN